jgi:hypothetical protein
MSRFNVVAKGRFTLLAVVVALVGAILFLMPPAPAAAFICADGFPITDTFYYSNAQHTTLVGECIGSCSGTRCTGKTSAYPVVVEAGCCDGP